MKPIKKSYKLSTIKDLTLAIKSDPYNQDLKIERGFIYLKKKNYKDATNDFSTVIWNHEQGKIRGLSITSFLYIRQDKLVKIYLFRGFAYAISGDMERSRKNFNYMGDYDFPMEYAYFITFSWSVLNKETDKAIHLYSKLRSYAKELMDFEEDLFNLLPIENIENLNESIKLLDLSLGISRKNRN